jgi:hypothetical protein
VPGNALNEYRPLPAELKVCSAAAIHPDLGPVIAPCLTLDAGRSAALVDHSDAPAGIRAAVVSFAVVRGAGDPLAAASPASVKSPAEPEVSAAAAIDPDAISIESPGLSLDAWRSTALINHTNTVLGRYLTKMTLAIIGGTSNLASTLCGDPALRTQGHTTERNPYQPRQIKPASAHLLLLV